MRFGSWRPYDDRQTESPALISMETFTTTNTTTEWLSGVSPLDGQSLESVKISSAAEISTVVQQAQAAQVEWAARSVHERAEIVRQAGLHMMSQADQLSAILHRELGKPITETYAVDLASAPEVFRYYAHHAPRLLKSERVSFNPIMFPGKSGRLDRLPHGVVALITPWNYPISIPLHNLVPALIAGNAVVLKPSEYAARTGALLHKLLAEKLPLGLLGLVQGNREAGEKLIQAEIDYIVFVGGLQGGRAVARSAAERVIPVSLELGGKDAAIVLEDADIDRAAHGIAWAGFVNAGQSCAGIERVYVVAPVAEAFTARLTVLARQMRSGDDAGNPGTVDLGPTATPLQYKIVRRQLEQALEAGARLECGGFPPADPEDETGNSQFFPATILTNVSPAMEIMREETFGPLIPIQIVQDEASAVAEANRGNFGLTGSVWTKDLERGKRVAAQLKVGVATVNNHMFSGASPNAAWQGRGFSGYGTQNGKLALQALTRPRLLAVDAHKTPRELWWFPYDRALLDLGRGLLATRAPWWKNPGRWVVAYARMLRGVAIRSFKQRQK